MGKTHVKSIMKLLLFCIVGLFIYIYITELFVPKRNYPIDKENVSYTFDTFYSQEENIDEVLFLGTSHCYSAISPMEIYKEYNYTTYNLGTQVQPIASTYYLLKEAFVTQSPKVVVLDASSSFYKDSNNDAPWKLILNNMPFGMTKIEAAMEYAKLEGDDINRQIERFVQIMFPLVEYHARWSTLDVTDFRDYYNRTDYYSAGYYLRSTYRDSGISIEMMNAYTEEYEENPAVYYEYRDGIRNVVVDESALYRAEISDHAKFWLNEIKVLCEENGAELLLVKYPTVQNPVYYGSAWTKSRSEEMKRIADDLDIMFLDLLYDVEYGFDTETDFWDGGGHLNYSGAKKTSMFLGEYLLNNYEIETKTNSMFDLNMRLYNELTTISELQLKRSFLEYIEYLRQNSHKYIICIAVNEEMGESFAVEEMEAMHELGLQTDFINDWSKQDAFIAFIDSGEVHYEILSNRFALYRCELENTKNISITSAGYDAGAYAHIEIDGIDYAQNKKGINIVVLDKSTLRVIDSVVFDMSEEENIGNHGKSSELIDQYWMYLQGY